MIPLPTTSPPTVIIDGGQVLLGPGAPGFGFGAGSLLGGLIVLIILIGALLWLREELGLG